MKPSEAVNRVGNSPSLEDRRKTVKEWFEAYPTLHHLSDREIAKRCDVDHKTVGKIRQEYFPKQKAAPAAKKTTLPRLPKTEPTKEVQQERETRRQQVQERNEQIKTTGVVLSKMQYPCLVVDPPWPMQKIEREERPNQLEFDYPIMKEEELFAFQLPELAADDCHLYLWTTQKHLPLALRLAEHWGFKYQCLMTWVKNVGFTPYSWMYSTEHVLFCTKGNLPLLATGKRLDFSAEVREHSRKPDEFYDLVKEVSPGPRLDMFSREKRDGFKQHGNEVEKYVSA